ncbi:MAG: DNA alkylation repair protein [Rectinemataceae bacterium]
MNTVIAELRKELELFSDEKTRNSGKKFFKEDVKSYGVKTALVGKIAKERYKDIEGLQKKDLFDICEELWRSGYMEESFIACNWSYFIHAEYEEKDFKVFERWIRTYVGNWAACDTLCNHTVGTFIEMYPEHVEALKKWAKSKNRWMRRASSVSLIVPAKHGGFLHDILAIADILLVDEDDLVQKGYGWMLKAASQAHQAEVFRYVMSRKSDMPRTALRYAIEKMPETLRKQAMEK